MGPRGCGGLVERGAVTSVRRMAHRGMDNGKDEARGAAARPGMETARPADAAPPGSRERSESDVSGWNPARDEAPSSREGRYHRAASLRMAQPRTAVEDRSDEAWASGGVQGGPYGRDDRDDHYATGVGPRARMGTQDRELSPQPADYRSWNREGYGGEESRMRGDAPGAVAGWRAREEAPLPLETSTLHEPPRRSEGRAFHTGDVDTELGLAEETLEFEARSHVSRPGERAGSGWRGSRDLAAPSRQHSDPERAEGGWRGASPSRQHPDSEGGVRGRRDLSAPSRQHSDEGWREEREMSARSRERSGVVRPEEGSREGREVSSSSRGGSRSERTSSPSRGTSGVERSERTFVADHLREDRSQDYRAPPLGMSQRWQREPLTARDVMTRNVRSVRRDSPLREVARIMKDEDCGVVPIVDEQGRLVGLVTDRDLALRAFAGGTSPEQLRAADVMTEDVEAVTLDESLHGLIDIMARRQIRRLPVIERDDRLVGIISLGDIAQRADADEELQHALERISARRSFWTRLR
ncbi:CBS domain-containing protein [Myxococcus sp. MISCRS1]|uniref:CBS domain-containing protein n=1 Tax=Myxococcus sp. MISCRS1 TaxID=2996786 RepID=UPI00227199F5|nr:CBS domain-containing protein [Myxococcus sp. MISCRS1]MCY0999525.1 CBS domain-containing protein [Myxococcus sp. MISCRS1]